MGALREWNKTHKNPVTSQNLSLKLLQRRTLFSFFSRFLTEFENKRLKLHLQADQSNKTSDHVAFFTETQKGLKFWLLFERNLL